MASGTPRVDHMLTSGMIAHVPGPAHNVNPIAALFDKFGASGQHERGKVERYDRLGRDSRENRLP